MKKLFVIILIAFAFCLQAQNYVTRFLDIPIEGSKKEFVKALKKKGFKKSKYDKDAFQGVFNGREVNIKFVEKDGIIKRVGVIPRYGGTVREARIEFNNLCRQFLGKDNYLPIGEGITCPTYKSLAIPSDEDIEYELLVHGKDYQAGFLQLPSSRDSIINQMEPSNVSITFIDDEGNDCDIAAYSKMVTDYSGNSVWFQIYEQNGKYFVVLFYDNYYEESSSDDL